MTSPLSLDLRRRVVAAYLAGEGSYAEIAVRFGIGEASVSRLLRRFRNTESLEPDPHGGGNPARIGPDDVSIVAEIVAANPDGTVAELAQAWTARTRRPISRSSMLRALRRFGFTLKKRPSTPRSKSARKSKRSGRVSRN